MKTLEEIKKCRRLKVLETDADGGRGLLRFPESGYAASVIWSNGLGWDHVSIAPLIYNRIPSWDDMSTLKDIFFQDEETVIEYHPPKSQYVNTMQNCLHLWRPQNAEIPLPPSILTGFRYGQSMQEAREEINKIIANT